MCSKTVYHSKYLYSVLICNHSKTPYGYSVRYFSSVLIIIKQNRVFSNFTGSKTVHQILMCNTTYRTQRKYTSSS